MNQSSGTWRMKEWQMRNATYPLATSGWVG